MSLFSLDNDELSLLDLYIRLNRPNAETLSHLPSRIREQLAMIAEPTVPLLVNEDQRPRALHTNLILLAMDEAAEPIISTHESSNETPDFQSTSALTNTIAPQNEPAPNTQPQSDGSIVDEATENGEEERKESKKKPAPRYDRVFECNKCETKQMELTRAKAHVSKKHEGSTFDEVMAEQPKKLRKSSVR